MITDAAESAWQPDRAWWERVLGVVDTGDADEFVRLLTPDAQFRFGNTPVIVGREPVRAAVAAFFSAIASSRHRLLGTWSAAGTAVCEGEVTYTRLDGSVISVPFANVFELCADKIAAYRIYIDNSSLFGEPV